LKKSLYLISFIAAFSIVISLFIPELNISGIEIKKFNLVSDLIPAFCAFDEDTLSGEENLKNLQMFLSDLPDDQNDTAFSGNDSRNFLEYYGTDSSGFLINFFKSLKRTERDGTKTRIAFLGDSMIEGDLISQTLRYKLQKKFGGKGVGYVPITAIAPGFRKSVIHVFSKNWRTYSLMNGNYDGRLGLSGFVFQPRTVNKNQLADSLQISNLSWVYLRSPEEGYENVKEFQTVKLYYRATEDINYVSSTGNTNTYFRLDGKDIVNELILNDSVPVNELKLYFNVATQTDVFGLSIESPSGIFVDNYSMRGNTGVKIPGLNKEILMSQNRFMNYSLIILQYGLNVTTPESRDLEWYKIDMVKSVNFLKECFPFSDIIIMSVGDKCYKKNGYFTTEPSIPLLVNIQQKIAEESGVIFWNLYETMGGKNSMVRWVKANPPLANKDFTHFNFEGAEKIGTFFYRQLMQQYINYRSRNNN
jgi:hypothetical protein